MFSKIVNNIKEALMKEKIDIGIIILHYNNAKDTNECIESIKNKIDTQSYVVIVVDNKSPNNTGIQLKEKYKCDDKVIILLNDKNEGFSAGLNVGIEYLHSKYDSLFTILSNSDIHLLDKNFKSHLIAEYENSDFSVLAPMIVTPDGRCDDNPIFDMWYPRENAKYDLKYWKHRLFFTKIGLERLYLFNRNHNYLVKKHKKKVYKTRKDRSPGIFLKRRENVVAHGCFIVLSKTFFKHFKGLDVRTFMYAEADVLFVHLLDKKLLSVYQPSIAVYHKGGSSVKTTYNVDKKRKLFLYKNYINAIKAYLSLIDELKM